MKNKKSQLGKLAKIIIILAVVLIVLFFLWKAGPWMKDTISSIFSRLK